MTRRPLDSWQRAPELDGKGEHKGILAKNLEPEIFLACFDGEKIDTELLYRLETTATLDYLYDVLELREVADSWRHAYYLNNPKGGS